MRTSGRRTSEREIICLVSDGLADLELDELRAQLSKERARVVVERRSRERRGIERRRVAGRSPTGRERRLINNPGGRRLAERRAPLVRVESSELDALVGFPPERLGAFRFVERDALDEVEAAKWELTRVALAAQGGDRAAGERLMAGALDFLYPRLLAIAGDHHDAEELAQEAAARLVAELPRYEFRPGVTIARWLSRVAANLSVSQHRRARATEPLDLAELARAEAPPAPEPALTDDPSDGLSWLTDAGLLAAFRRLSEAQRQVLSMHYLLDLSHAEIGSILGSTPEAVRMAKSRAMRSLRRELEPAETGSSRHRRHWMRARTRPAPVLASRRFALRQPRGGAVLTRRSGE